MLVDELPPPLTFNFNIQGFDDVRSIAIAPLRLKVSLMTLFGRIADLVRRFGR
jgi:hypothetical protein